MERPNRLVFSFSVSSIMCINPLYVSQQLLFHILRLGFISLPVALAVGESGPLRVRPKCYLLTSAVCVSMPSLQDNRHAEQASINNRQLHRALKRMPLLICHRSSLALSRLVPRLRETHTTGANKPFHQPGPVCGYHHPRIGGRVTRSTLW